MEGFDARRYLLYSCTFSVHATSSLEFETRIAGEKEGAFLQLVLFLHGVSRSTARVQE